MSPVGNGTHGRAPAQAMRPTVPLPTRHWAGQLAVAIACVQCLGCGLLMKGHHSQIPIRSRPSGAQVWADGSYVGTTPLRVSLASSRPHIVEVRAEGRLPQSYRLEPRVEPGYVVLDILLTGPLGVAVDAATGGWRDLRPADLSVRLARSPPGAAAPPPRVGQPDGAPPEHREPPGARPTGSPAVPDGYLLPDGTDLE